MTSGPCVGTSGSGVTAAAGTAAFSYTCNTTGTDTITATAPVGGADASDSANEDWVLPTCIGYYVVGARGSGEGDSQEDDYGYGRTVFAAIEAFQSSVAPTRVLPTFLDYPLYIPREED